MSLPDDLRAAAGGVDRRCKVPRRRRTTLGPVSVEMLIQAADEIEQLSDKALRFDLDQSGIKKREREAIELVEARAEIKRLNDIVTKYGNEITGRLMPEIDRLRSLADVARLDVMWQELVRERDDAKREIERLQGLVDSPANDVERLQSKITQANLDRLGIEKANEDAMVLLDACVEIDRLSRLATLRGGRMQIMREWMAGASSRGASSWDGWEGFLEDHQEAIVWFDEDGVPR